MNSLTNVLFMATHGTYAAPDAGVFDGVDCRYEFSDAFKNIVLQKNFSDFATGEILKQFNQANVFPPPKYGRAFVDSNRALLSVLEQSEYEHPFESGIFHTKDFSGTEVFKHEPTLELRKHMVKTVYEPYLNGVLDQIEAMLAECDGNIFIVDIHDTGNYLIQADGSLVERVTTLDSGEQLQGFVGAIVSDFDHKAADEQHTKAFVAALEAAYASAGIDLEAAGGMHVNEVFKGAGVLSMATTCRGRLEHQNRSDDAGRIHAIQLEVNRSRLLDEATQELKPDGIAREAAVILQAAQQAFAN